MSTAIKTFVSRVTDEYGGVWPKAILAVRAFSETSQATGYSDNCEDAYTVESDVEAITYKVNYWYTEQTKAAGKRSRPLIKDEHGTFTDVFSVDVGAVEVQEILSSSAGHFDNVLRSIESDAIRRFN